VNCTLAKKSYSHNDPHNPIKNRHITAHEKIIQSMWTILLKIDINVYPAAVEIDEHGKHHVIWA
jgi:hypothetical protein